MSGSQLPASPGAESIGLPTPHFPGHLTSSLPTDPSQEHDPLDNAGRSIPLFAGVGAAAGLVVGGLPGAVVGASVAGLAGASLNFSDAKHHQEAANPSQAETDTLPTATAAVGDQVELGESAIAREVGGGSFPGTALVGAAGAGVVDYEVRDEGVQDAEESQADAAGVVAEPGLKADGTQYGISTLPEDRDGLSPTNKALLAGGAGLGAGAASAIGAQHLTRSSSDFETPSLPASSAAPGATSTIPSPLSQSSTSPSTPSPDTPHVDSPSSPTPLAANSSAQEGTGEEALENKLAPPVTYGGLGVATGAALVSHRDDDSTGNKLSSGAADERLQKEDSVVSVESNRMREGEGKKEKEGLTDNQKAALAGAGGAGLGVWTGAVAADHFKDYDTKPATSSPLATSTPVSASSAATPTPSERPTFDSPISREGHHDGPVAQNAQNLKDKRHDDEGLWVNGKAALMGAGAGAGVAGGALAADKLGDGDDEGVGQETKVDKGKGKEIEEEEDGLSSKDQAALAAGAAIGLGAVAGATVAGHDPKEFDPAPRPAFSSTNVTTNALAPSEVKVGVPSHAKKAKEPLAPSIGGLTAAEQIKEDANEGTPVGTGQPIASRFHENLATPTFENTEENSSLQADKENVADSANDSPRPTLTSHFSDATVATDTAFQPDSPTYKQPKFEDQRVVLPCSGLGGADDHTSARRGPLDPRELDDVAFAPAVPAIVQGGFTLIEGQRPTTAMRDFAALSPSPSGSPQLQQSYSPSNQSPSIHSNSRMGASVIPGTPPPQGYQQHGASEGHQQQHQQRMSLSTHSLQQDDHGVYLRQSDGTASPAGTMSSTRAMQGSPTSSRMAVGTPADHSGNNSDSGVALSPHMKIATRKDSIGHNRLSRKGSLTSSAGRGGQHSPQHQYHQQQYQGHSSSSPHDGLQGHEGGRSSGEYGLAGERGSPNTSAGEGMWNDSVRNVVDQETEARGKKPTLVTIESGDQHDFAPHQYQQQPIRYDSQSQSFQQGQEQQQQQQPPQRAYEQQQHPSSGHQRSTSTSSQPGSPSQGHKLRKERRQSGLNGSGDAKSGGLLSKMLGRKRGTSVSSGSGEPGARTSMDS